MLADPERHPGQRVAADVADAPLHPGPGEPASIAIACRTAAGIVSAELRIRRQLREAGFRQMRATSLKGRHVSALIERWKAEKLSAGTLKNRMAHLRWWAEKVGRPGIIPADNVQLAIPRRQFVTNEDKGQPTWAAAAKVADSPQAVTRCRGPGH